MKLSNYFEKSVRVRPKRSQRIVVTNEHVKQKFDVQISHLETRNNELQDTIIKLQTEIQEIRTAYRKVGEDFNQVSNEATKVAGLQLENARLQQRVDELTPLQNSIPELEKALSKEQELFQTIQQEHMENLNTLQQTTSLVSELKVKLKHSQDQLEEETIRASWFDDKYPIAISQGDTLRQNIKELEERLLEGDKDIELLSTNFFYWKDAAAIFQAQLNEEAHLREEIQRSLDILSYENTLETKKVTKSSTAYSEAKEVILTLQNRNVELTKFTDQLSKIVLEQKKQLVSAGRLSQGAIGAKENFHIPFAKENLRTRQLGNAPPTLLKFKETTNDNN